MENSVRFGLPLLVAGQGQKDITHNEAIVALDCLLHVAVESSGLLQPPASAQAGSAWIVGAPAEGAWEGQEGRIACLTPGGWRFFAPAAGLAVWNVELGRAQRFDGTSWRLEPVPASSVPAAPAVSGGTVVDAEARAAVSAIVARLRDLGLFSTT